MWISFLLSFAISAWLTAIALKYFPSWGLLDYPERYGITRSRLPYPFGIVAGIALLISIGILLGTGMVSFSEEDSSTLPKIGGFITAGILLSLISFFDDKYRISPLIRLGVQVICVGIVFLSGIRIEFLTNPFGGDAFAVNIFWSALLSGIWILSLINTSNWMDGVPNLSLASSGIAAAILGFLSLSDRVLQPEVALLCFLFVGAVLPLLAINIPKERYILGDSGAMFAGFCIAIFSLFAGGKLATALIVLILPVLDAGYVIIDRLRSGVSPLSGGDKRHLHDILLQKGWSNHAILILFLSFSTILGMSALFLGTFGKILLLSVMTGIFVWFRVWIGKKQ